MALLAPLLAVIVSIAASLAAPTSSPPSSSRPFRRDPGFAYGSEPVRGVNLGGWLVLEPWITPSIFDDTGNTNIVDEWTFGEYQDYDTALSTLQAHWGTWIQYSDLEAIANAGLNHVRIPIGFWAFDNTGTPYIQDSQYQYLKDAITWAGWYGVKVLIDLHGVPGSQNGYDNSGQRGTPTWQDDEDNVSRTLAIIQTLSQEFSQEEYWGIVTAIELVNEPAGYYSTQLLDTARQYYTDAYPLVRADGSLVVVLHDAFQGLAYWDGFMTPSTGAGWVMLDTHIYQVFDTYDLSLTWDEHISNACQNGPSIQSYAESNLWTIVGEWTTASTDCAEYINGRGYGSRYDGSYDGSAAIGSCTGLSGSSSTFSSDYTTFMRQFWEAQVTAYEMGQGWIYWCWKNENADDWSYSVGLSGGWIPQNPSDREYPDICS